jgi:hypothetical protein
MLSEAKHLLSATLKKQILRLRLRMTSVAGGYPENEEEGAVKKTNRL